MEFRKENNDILALKNIHANYYSKKVLRGVSLTIGKGEIVSLIGPNGAGKSTLLKVISGVLPATSGKVYFRDKDITLYPPHLRIRTGIGYFVQGGLVFHNLSVKENLEIGGFGLSKHKFKKQMQDILSLFPSLKEILSKRAMLVSGGEKQMLALGIILMREPDVVLLDEPSVGLSPKLVRKLIEKIKQIQQKKGTSILLVEQNKREALRISSRTYILKDGEVVGEENPKNLDKEKLEKLFFSPDKL